MALNRLEARLPADRHALDDAVLHQCTADRAVQAQAHARREDHLIQDQLRHFRVKGGLPVRV